MNIEQLRTYCLSKALTTEDLPFDENTLAFKVGGKIFALTNLKNTERTVNLKCAPEYALQLRNEYPDWIVPGYHMNKKHWNTVNFEHLSSELIGKLIDHSYELVVQKLPKKIQQTIKTADEDCA